MDKVPFLRYIGVMKQSKLLLEWYKNFGRDLPWRVKGGAHPDPYVILVSEFMLQQTTVKTVIPYFARFMRRFPTLQDLAAADIEDVYLFWQGLGYYTRAKSLHATAQMIMERGSFPQDRKGVLKLKGIGNYTASSFLALAFNLPETVIDGNVIRVICRLYNLTSPIDEIMPIIQDKATALTDKENPADYASALMDLGAMICTPKNPQCLLCPWKSFCKSKDLPHLESIPQKSKPEKKAKNAFVYLIINSNGELFIRKRSEKGLLSGLYEFPWSETPPEFAQGAKDTGLEVSHIFTHIKLNLKIQALYLDDVQTDGFFAKPDDFKNYPFSTLMSKVYKAYARPERGDK